MSTKSELTDVTVEQFEELRTGTATVKCIDGESRLNLDMDFKGRSVCGKLMLCGEILEDCEELDLEDGETATGQIAVAFSGGKIDEDVQWDWIEEP